MALAAVYWPLTLWGFLVWLLNVGILRKSAFGKFSGSLSMLEVSPALRGIRNGSAGWQALHIIYNWYGHFGFRPEMARDPLAGFWIKMRNAQAVRNRLRIIVQELQGMIRRVSETEDEIRIFSIASGSAQSLFMAVQGFA